MRLFIAHIVISTCTLACAINSFAQEPQTDGQVPNMLQDWVRSGEYDTNTYSRIVSTLVDSANIDGLVYVGVFLKTYTDCTEKPAFVETFGKGIERIFFTQSKTDQIRLLDCYGGAVFGAYPNHYGVIPCTDLDTLEAMCLNILRTDELDLHQKSLQWLYSVVAVRIKEQSKNPDRIVSLTNFLYEYLNRIYKSEIPNKKRFGEIRTAWDRIDFFLKIGRLSIQNTINESEIPDIGGKSVGDLLTLVDNLPRGAQQLYVRQVLLDQDSLDNFDKVLASALRMVQSNDLDSDFLDGVCKKIVSERRGDNDPLFIAVMKLIDDMLKNNVVIGENTPRRGLILLNSIIDRKFIKLDERPNPLGIAPGVGNSISNGLLRLASEEDKPSTEQFFFQSKHYIYRLLNSWSIAYPDAKSDIINFAEQQILQAASFPVAESNRKILMDDLDILLFEPTEEKEQVLHLLRIMSDGRGGYKVQLTNGNLRKMLSIGEVFGDYEVIEISADTNCCKIYLKTLDEILELCID